VQFPWRLRRPPDVGASPRLALASRRSTRLVLPPSRVQASAARMFDFRRFDRFCWSCPFPPSRPKQVRGQIHPKYPLIRRSTTGRLAGKRSRQRAGGSLDSRTESTAALRGHQLRRAGRNPPRCERQRVPGACRNRRPRGGSRLVDATQRR